MRARSVGAAVAASSLAALFFPLRADMSVYGFGDRLDCGWVWSPGTDGPLPPPLDEVCGDAAIDRLWMVLAVGLLTVVVLLVMHAIRGGITARARFDRSDRRGELVVVCLAHLAPLTGFGIILPAALYFDNRRDPRLAISAARAFDVQLALAAFGLGAVALKVAVAPPGAPDAILGLLVAAALLWWIVLTVRSVAWASGGESWRSSWRPLLITLTERRSSLLGSAVRRTA